MKNWKTALVSPDDSIQKVIRTIDASAMQIALVVDSHRKLLGTVTDGDVRRGTLKGIALTTAAKSIMEKKPITASPEESRETLLALMRRKRIHQIPLIDARGRIVGIEVLDDILRSNPQDNWVVIMAGGLGSRLRPLTDDCPKPLLQVGTKPILQTIIENLAEQGFRRFYLSVNYKNKMVSDYFGDGLKWDVQIRYLKESKRLGTAGSLSLLAERPKKPLLVMNGDLLTKVNFGHLLNFHSQNKSNATMCVREYDFQVPYGVVKIKKHKVFGLSEKPTHRFFVNAGIYVLEPAALKYIQKKMHLDMPHLFEKLLKKKQAVTAFPIREYWLDIGRMDDLERAKDDFQKVFVP